ncbi:MAG TPA: transcription antitermination factor NusB [Prochlorococcus sp.]
MQSRSLARELALLVLGQISERESSRLQTTPLEGLLDQALDSLMQHWREKLDICATELENAHQHLLDSELQDRDSKSVTRVREHLQICLTGAEQILNGLSASMELPRLLALGNQEQVRLAAMQRVTLAVEQRKSIDERLDSVMEGWRLSRLPRIDRDILRLAVVDLISLQTPAAVACNEAVELAHRYSDDQGRRMINGVLRRLHDSSPVKLV